MHAPWMTVGRTGYVRNPLRPQGTGLRKGDMGCASDSTRILPTEGRAAQTAFEDPMDGRPRKHTARKGTARGGASSAAEAGILSEPLRSRIERGRVITLLDLVFELGEAGASEREIVAAVVDLVHTGGVQLVGQIREGDFCGGKGRKRGSDPRISARRG